MRKYMLTVFVVLIAAGCTGGGEAESGPSGKQIYDVNCVTCHGATGIGDGPAGASLEIPDLTDGEWTHGGSQAEIESVITNGVAGTPMISWKSGLSAAEIKSVAEYVKSLS